MNDIWKTKVKYEIMRDNIADEYAYNTHTMTHRIINSVQSF